MNQEAQEAVKFVLRIDRKLHRKIKRSAKSNNTSMNKEITNVLTQGYATSGIEQDVKDLIRRLEKKKVI